MSRTATEDRLSPRGTVVVFENAPRWVPELQRQLPADRVAVRLRTRVSDVIDALREPQVRLLIVDLHQQEAAVLQLLGRRLTGALPQVPCLAIAPARDRSLEWPIRELGVSGYYEEPVRVDRLVRTMCEHFLNSATD